MARVAADVRTPAETREQLRRAARRLFAERGYDGTGIRDLAKEAGVNAALVQYHFGNKQGLLNDILREDCSWAVEQLRAAVARATGAQAQLGAFIETVAEVSRQRPWFSFILTREQIGGSRHLDAGVRDRLFDFFRMTSAILKTGRAAGELRPVNLHAAHLSLMGTLVYFALTQPARTTYERLPDVPGERLTVRDYVGHVKELFTKGLMNDTTMAKRVLRGRKHTPKKARSR